MEKWQNFFLQRMGTDSDDSAYPASDTTYAVYESVDTWGVYCKEIPFQIFNDVKEPAKRTWNDEHGDDEFISDDGLYLQAYEMKVEFACKMNSSVDDVRENVGTFLEYLRASGMMYMYSSYTRIGRRYVRVDKIDNNAKWVSKDYQEFLTFDVTFKVNDPITDITLTT